MAEPAIDFVKTHTALNIEVKNPRLYTTIIPNIKVKAEDIKLLNKDNSVALELEYPKLNLRLLPLLSGKIHLNSLLC